MLEISFTLSSGKDIPINSTALCDWKINEMNEQLGLVLPSKSSLNIFQENKTSSYKVQLTYPLELYISKWEIALSEIQFPNNFYTIRDGHNRIIK